MRAVVREGELYIAKYVYVIGSEKKDNSKVKTQWQKENSTRISPRSENNLPRFAEPIFSRLTKVVGKHTPSSVIIELSDEN